jgi:hypothetical protein
MPRGSKPGERRGGRQKGTPNKKRERIAKIEHQVAVGLMPIDFMLEAMRNTSLAFPWRADMAKAAAPYVHPRLATIDHRNSDGGLFNLQIKQFFINVQAAPAVVSAAMPDVIEGEIVSEQSNGHAGNGMTVKRFGNGQ